MSTTWYNTKHWAVLLVVDFLLAGVSLALSIPAVLLDSKPVSMGVAGSVAGVAFAWSLSRGRDVFGDVATDMLTRHPSSQRWLVLGRQWEWGPAEDLRLRWSLQCGSRLCLVMGGGLGTIWIIVSLVAYVT